ncbi:TPA: hypothetical protein ACX6SR_003192 [Photobacterium damselae]
MRHTRSAAFRMRLKKKKSVTRFWGLASHRRNRLKIKSHLKRSRQIRITAEYVLLADSRKNEPELKLVA